jgi:hypothetical protein
MSLLQASVDTAVIALWLGHADLRSTGIYLHADMTIKQKALDATIPASAAPVRFQPDDKLLAARRYCQDPWIADFGLVAKRCDWPLRLRSARGRVAEAGKLACSGDGDSGV